MERVQGNFQHELIKYGAMHDIARHILTLHKLEIFT